MNWPSHKPHQVDMVGAIHLCCPGCGGPWATRASFPGLFTGQSSGRQQTAASRVVDSPGPFLSTNEKAAQRESPETGTAWLQSCQPEIYPDVGVKIVRTAGPRERPALSMFPPGCPQNDRVL